VSAGDPRRPTRRSSARPWNRQRMNPRFTALDVFRGAAVALMILVNNPGSWAHMYPPLAHAPWHGCTPTDLVFPFFLFAVGNALGFVMPGLQRGPAAVFWAKVAKRTALIFLIGWLLNLSPFVRWDAQGELVLRSLETLRTMGVLQRIALCWGAAAVIVWACGHRGAGYAAAALLLGYWAACLAWGQPGDPYSLQGFFGTAIDRALLGEAHLYKGEGVPFDPEGLASTVPAIAQVLLGYLAGTWVQRSKAGPELVARLFVAALLALVVAYVWQLGFPLNKKIWSSSYVLHTTGLALASLADRRAAAARPVDQLLRGLRQERALRLCHERLRAACAGPLPLGRRRRRRGQATLAVAAALGLPPCLCRPVQRPAPGLVPVQRRQPGFVLGAGGLAGPPAHLHPRVAGGHLATRRRGSAAP
jgi:predicted acyltransferase